MANKVKILSIYDGGDFTTQINPASVKIGKKVSYEKIQAMGSSQFISRYKNHEPSTMSFEIYMDDTGAVPNFDGLNIQSRIEQLENTVYTIQDEYKEPGYIVLVWGSTIFHGRADSLDYDYSLFSPDGSPLRVKISLSFVGSFEKGSNTSSPSEGQNTLTFSAGDRLADYCETYYADPSYCADVALFNNLHSIRDIIVGTVLLFPPIKR